MELLLFLYSIVHVLYVRAEAVLNFLLWGVCVVFYSHEKKFQETKHKLSEAEKVGEDMSELKAALQELQQEGEKIKHKEEEIKKKEKVCMCSVIYVCVLKLIKMQIQADMKTIFTIAEKHLAGSSLLYWLLVMIMVGSALHCCLQNIGLHIRIYSICGCI
jgi:hypothetical protein